MKSMDEFFDENKPPPNQDFFCQQHQINTFVANKDKWGT